MGAATPPQFVPTAEWHALDAAAALEALAADAAGLTAAEAEARLRRAGANRLPRAAPPPWWRILLRQFVNPLIYILAAAAGLSLALGDVSDAGFIAAVLVINALVGGYQEWRADRRTRALQQLLQIRAAAERDGEVREIDAERLVPGDIVWLESGNRVPADLRLLAAHGLEIDEALLTGESMPVLKDAAWRGAAHTSLADRLNMAHAGSIVVRGRGKGVVAATGSATHVGRLALDVLDAPRGQPPLLLRLERFSRMVGAAVLASAVVIGLLGILAHGRAVSEMFLFAVALAVAAIPEGLPVSITIALAIATTRMARRGVIVRRLGAVEGLGSCTLVVSDKTGTLTCNELTAREIRLADGAAFQATGEGFAPHGQVLRDGTPVAPASQGPLEPLLRAAVLCNEGDLHQRDGTWAWRGDPTDVALLSLAHKLGWSRETTLDAWPQINQIPFEPEHRFAATYHRDPAGGVHVFVKGAPEAVLNMAVSPNGAADRAKYAALAEDMAARGQRVLALAQGRAPDNLDETQAAPPPANLTLLGFVGMIDPLRPGTRAAVAACHGAGLAVSMVTGDHPVTARAIARELELARDAEQCVAGAELEGKSAEELRTVVRQARVFARTAPHQKLQIVQAAQQNGHFVAVTGDGANDAPALRAANIGVAMGRSGTDVAREAADLAISDDNFATLVAGVEEGRIAYQNIRNVIFLLISTGAAEVVLVALAVAAGLPLPLLPAQLLWLNLVTNGIQDKALAFEPGQGDELRRPPRPPREPIFNRLMIERTALSALVIGGVGFLAFWWMLARGWSAAAARNGLLLLMVLFEIIHLGNCRSETKPALVLSPLRSPYLLAGAVGALLIHLAAMHTPFLQNVLQIEPVAWPAFFALLGLSLTVFVAMEVHKWLWNRRQNKSGGPPLSCLA